MLSTGSMRLWVLVTDGHRARVVAPAAPGGQFHTLLTLGVAEYPYCPPPLRTGFRTGAHGQFTTDVARRIDEAAEQDAFDRLIVLAPRAIADEIRRALHPAARERIAVALDHDYVMLDDSTLSVRLARWWLAPEPTPDVPGDVTRAAATA